jgi:hypothetical protein
MRAFLLVFSRLVGSSMLRSFFPTIFFQGRIPIRDKPRPRYGPSTLVFGKALSHFAKFFLSLFHDFAAPVQTKYFRRTLKRAEHSTVRPFSFSCDAVSIPLQVRSRYSTVVGPSTQSESSPLGDTFTWPAESSGAELTKKIAWPSINFLAQSSMIARTFPLAKSSFC